MQHTPEIIAHAVSGLAHAACYDVSRVLFDREESLPSLNEIDAELAALNEKSGQLLQRLAKVRDRQAQLEEARAMEVRAQELVDGKAPVKRVQPKRLSAKRQAMREEIEVYLIEATEAAADVIRHAVAQDDRHAGQQVYMLLNEMAEEGVVEKLSKREGHAPVYRWRGYPARLSIP